MGDTYGLTGFEFEGKKEDRRRHLSRRQTDKTFSRKMKTYGIPDNENHQKRPYDKFSHSAGARRKQEKKGGAGAWNWGGVNSQILEEEW